MSTPQFDHEKLDVYQLSLEFITFLSDILTELRRSNSPGLHESINQIDRASTSIALNIAEGNGRRASQQRARFFDDARGSATESAACIDILVAKKAITKETAATGKSFLLRIVSMLSKLVDKFDTRSPRVKEEDAEGYYT